MYKHFLKLESREFYHSYTHFQVLLNHTLAHAMSLETNRPYLSHKSTEKDLATFDLMLQSILFPQRFDYQNKLEYLYHPSSQVLLLSLTTLLVHSSLITFGKTLLQHGGIHRQ